MTPEQVERERAAFEAACRDAEWPFTGASFIRYAVGKSERYAYGEIESVFQRGWLARAEPAQLAEAVAVAADNYIARYGAIDADALDAALAAWRKR
jgi:hypothetical protein